MDIYLDSKGNASITEVWDADLTSGTEGYRPYTKLGNSQITDFTVTDDTGVTYTPVSTWNTKSTFDDKAYKNGIHQISNGVELCWGISSYGDRTYTLKYKISNFVTQYTDAQGIYFNFIKLDQEVGHVTIKIHSDIPFSLDNSRIWAFGNDGTISFEDGSIVLDSGGILKKSQYMVALVRFESKLFTTDNTSDKSFDDIYDSAMEDVSESEKPSTITKTDNKRGNPSFWGKLILLLNVAVPLFIFFNIYYLISRNSNKEELYFGPKGNTLPDDDEINYWREIPCDGDLERTYWLCKMYNIVDETTLKKGLFGAILLKWIKDGYITVSKTKKGIFSLKDNNYAIDFSKMHHADNEMERELFRMLKEAAGENLILEANEFTKWCRKRYVALDLWYSGIIHTVQGYFEQERKITPLIEEKRDLFGKITIAKKVIGEELKESAIQIKGLKKFLLNFGSMPEKEYIDVHIWENYLIFAHLLGIADKVEEQFSKLYPNFKEQSLIYAGVTTEVARSMANLCYEGIRSGYIRSSLSSSSGSSSSHDYGGSSRDSGGGGSSYSGGGSSSGGSSGGGFR
jgi:uncharacterized membrane protein YgcG